MWLDYNTLNLQPTLDSAPKNTVAAETALSLQPNLGEALLARAITTTPVLRNTRLQSVTLSKRASSYRIAAEFLKRWPMLHEGEASGTEARRTSMKPSCSTRAMLTYSPACAFLPRIRRFPKRS